MAKKRMFSLQIVDTDAFLDMPLSSQVLYFHLVMRADDEGFIGNPKKIMRMVGCQDDDMRVLISKRFILTFKSGVVVIKHWLIHNTIRMDRFNQTAYMDEKEQIFLKENKAYTENGNQMATNGKPNGNQMVPQIKLNKIKLNKDKGKTSRFSPPSIEEVSDYCVKRKNEIDPQHFIDFYKSKGWLIGKNKMKDWRAAIRTWEKRDKPKENNTALRDEWQPPV